MRAKRLEEGKDGELGTRESRRTFRTLKISQTIPAETRASGEVNLRARSSQ